MDEHISDHFWTKDEDIAYLKNFTDENVYLEMPLVNMTYRMLDMAAQGLPLTKAGNPTTAVIEELYPLGPKTFFGKIILEKMVLSAVPQWDTVWDYLQYVELFRKNKGTLRLTTRKRDEGTSETSDTSLFYYIQLMTDTELLDSYNFAPFNNSLNHVAVLLDTYGDEFRNVNFYAAKYAEVNLDFAFCYEMTEPQYINKAVPYFNVYILWNVSSIGWDLWI